MDLNLFDGSPIITFNNWYEVAQSSNIKNYNAMVLSTIGLDNNPNARTVLLKFVSKKGFVFFTNYNSQKAKEIANNPNCCLTFYWHELDKQIRISGVCEKISSNESDKYFKSRNRSKQIGAWASKQSNILEDNLELENRIKHFEQKFTNKEIPRPDFWGGLVLKPNTLEFWQEGENRLHNRVVYKKKQSQDSWKILKLYP